MLVNQRRKDIPKSGMMKIPKEYLGAFKAGHRPSAREFIDDELSFELLRKVLEGDQEAKRMLEYITRFNNEFHKNVIKKGDKKALHNTDELRKQLYDRENARNRDISSKNQGSMYSWEYVAETQAVSEADQSTTVNSGRNLFNHEDVVIELIEQKKKLS